MILLSYEIDNLEVGSSAYVAVPLGLGQRVHVWQLQFSVVTFSSILLF